MKTSKQPTIEEKKAREQRIHERRMKHKRPKKRFQFWKNIEFWVIFGLFAFIAYTRYVYHNNTELLNDDYIITTGYIYKEGGFRTSRSFYYYFNVYSAEFKGSTSSHIPNKKVGDTIQVRYYVPNPAINRWEGDMH